MGDGFEPAHPGDSVSFSAGAWNAMLGAGREYLSRSQIGPGILTRTESTTIIRVKNETGSNVDRRSVLGLNGPMFAPVDNEDAFLQEVTFKGGIPDDTKHKRRFCITLEPAISNQVIRACLSGLVQVKVDILDTSHEYARIIDAQKGHLISSRFGHARILWREGDTEYGYGYDTGLQWAIVLVGVTGSCFAVGRANGDIDPRSGSTFGTGLVDLYRSDAGSEDGPLETIDVLNASETTYSYGAGIPDGMWVSVAWDADDNPFVAPLECDDQPYG